MNSFSLPAKAGPITTFNSESYEGSPEFLEGSIFIPRGFTLVTLSNFVPRRFTLYIIDGNMADATLSSLPIAKFEKGLRDAVASLNSANSTEDLTINKVRKEAEDLLELEEGFFTTNTEWKQNSKRIIKAEVENLHAAPTLVHQQENSPVLKAKPRGYQKPDQIVNRKSKKRPSPENSPIPKSAKKAKINQSDSESPSQLSSPSSSSSQAEDVDKPLRGRGRPAKGSAGSASHSAEAGKTSITSKRRTKQPPNSKAKSHILGKREDEKTTLAEESSRTLSKTLDSQSDLSSVPDLEASLSETEKTVKQNISSDGELSSVLDEPPKVKRRQRTAKEPSARNSKKPPKSKVQAGSDVSSEDAEIKRLQGWLVKCGVRKVWGKELKPHETPKAKIKHLRQLLEDVGMRGRFSVEKARDIRERRELAADIAEVQERTQRWGKAESSDPDSGGKPKRRLVRGSRAFDFLGDDAGEETD